MSTAAYNAWISAGRPNNGPIRPLKMLRDRLRGYGYTVYDLGDTSHQQHNPPEDHTCFSATGWPVTAQRWWIHAIDIMPPPAGSGLPSLQRLGAQLLADKKAGVFEPLKYMNWEPERDWGGACYQERFMPTYVRRTSSDRGHIHLSGRSDMVTYTGADNYDPVARLRGTTTPTQGVDMPLTQQDLIAIWTHDLVDGPGTGQAYKLINQLVADVADLKARPAAEVAMTPADREAIVTGVVGGRVTNTAFLAAVAKAVADENARRQQA